jgi:hypothetical protein
MKTAQQVLEEIALTVCPPPGVTIEITECPGDEPNWAAAATPMSISKSHEFAAKVFALRRISRLVDWKSVYERTHTQHRTVQWTSEFYRP